VGWEAGWADAPAGAAAASLERGARKPPPAAAAAEAHAAALPHMTPPPARELLLELPLSAYRWATGQPADGGGGAGGGEVPYACNPGSVRVTATEWSLPRARFRLLTRLALLRDEWLWAYNLALAQSMGGWDRYLRDLTHTGAARLHAEGCLVIHDDDTAGDAKSIKGPSTIKAVRNEASWILLPSIAKSAISAPDAALMAAGGAPVSPSQVPPALPPAAAANASFFKLLHWWPGYDFDGGGGDRGMGAPPLSSFIKTVPPPEHIMQALFGDAWVIAGYMSLSGVLVLLSAVLQCRLDNSNRRRIEKNRSKSAGEDEGKDGGNKKGKKAA
jgi:hypothetical protein